MMITRCPECATAFRVSQQQLEARVGQVRCGRCGEIFDASATLESSDDGEARQERTSPDEATTIRVLEPALAPEETLDRPCRETADAETLAEAETVAEADLTAAEADGPADELSAAVTTTEPAAAVIEADRVAASTPRRPQSGRDPGIWAPRAQAAAARYAARSGSSPSPFAGGRAKARPATGWWLFLSVVLLLALLAQALFHFRGTLALLLPETKPYIYTLCAELGCEVPLPRRAELISIETSDLQADTAHPGVLVLSATLRNRAAFPQDFPALELTLTNERDQPLARRVLQPRDYLRRTPDEGFPASSEQQIRLHLEAAELKASGYRMYLFYP
jgi:predicted Zn finger-like uncharacterized protein